MPLVQWECPSCGKIKERLVVMWEHEPHMYCYRCLPSGMLMARKGDKKCQPIPTNVDTATK